MRTASSLTVYAAVLTASVAAHSWLECTNYNFAPNSDDAKIWNKAKCEGNARCGKRQAESGFGVDTGFNFQTKNGCQCARSADNYEGIAKATYTPGQRVCLAYPPKNHVAAPCTNEYIPDSGTVITRTALNPKSDDDSAFVHEYEDNNGKHVKGTMDYKGFQNCPNFCADKEKALCTMCFDLERDIEPGEYTFKWAWTFNEGDSAYTTCWEATVKGDAPSGGSTTPSTTPPTEPNDTPAVTSPTSEPTPGPTSEPTPAPVANDSDNSEDCEDGPDVPVSYGSDCEDGPDVPANYGSDCEDGPDVPVNYPTPAPGGDEYAGGDADGKPNQRPEQPDESESDDDCSVDSDKPEYPTRDAPDVDLEFAPAEVKAYPDA
ncbi:hypothetical protein Poli38472_011099 [Pythium oligandrum]|uniref:Secreted protein n=1 Tax=Pythium oligandrum TaxID=41045 RepID=A0A8K1CPZ2_PYTOL|nr:hypothetical protein Poli38472_011099 [Pythium oligandrum]|eukprot:TMW67479.1 hypothetical protein Poli38472_011099 [Pythium oligandrum]